MSTELVERLRADVRAHEITGNGEMKRVQTVREAADELTALTAKVALLTEALKGLDAPWVQFISCWNDPSGDAEYDAEEEKDNVKVLADAMLAARRALSEPDKEGT